MRTEKRKYRATLDLEVGSSWSTSCWGAGCTMDPVAGLLMTFPGCCWSFDISPVFNGEHGADCDGSLDHNISMIYSETMMIMHCKCVKMWLREFFIYTTKESISCNKEWVLAHFDYMAVEQFCLKESACVRFPCQTHFSSVPLRCTPSPVLANPAPLKVPELLKKTNIRCITAMW